VRHTRDPNELLEVLGDKLWSIVGNDPRFNPGVLLFGPLQNALDVAFGHPSQQSIHRGKVSQGKFERRGKLGCSATASPRPTWFDCLNKFAAFLWQIAPIGPVLPTSPVYKPFAVNKERLERYLDTV
jgi:hypothetical protein